MGFATGIVRRNIAQKSGNLGALTLGAHLVAWALHPPATPRRSSSPQLLRCAMVPTIGRRSDG